MARVLRADTKSLGMYSSGGQAKRRLLAGEELRRKGEGFREGGEDKWR